MQTSDSPGWRSRLTLIGINLLIALVLGELVLRLFGFETLSEYHLVSQPNHHLAPHPERGFQLLSGTFSVTINDSLNYETTHAPTPWGVQRITSPTPDETRSPTLLLSGCSFLYGMGVSDEATYPFRLQQRYSSLNIKNAGVPAHGTLQSLMKLREYVAQELKPEGFIYHYLDSHQERNLMGRSFAQLLRVETAISAGTDTILTMGFPQGSITAKSENLQIQSMEVGFEPWLGSAREWSVLANQLEELINRWSHSRKEAQAVTKASILEMNRICQEEGIAFAVAIFSEDPKRPFMERLCKSEGLPYIDLTVDYTDPSYFNWPYDGHPNASTHQLYAERVWQFLQQNDWLSMIPE